MMPRCAKSSLGVKMEEMAGEIETLKLEREVARQKALTQIATGV